MNKFFLMVFVFCFANTTFAQSNNSPYSIIGVGDIEKSSLDRTTGMGYSGVALNSSKSLFNGNPASYSFLENHFFHIETSLRYKGIEYAGKPITSVTNNQSSDFVTKKIIFAIKPKNRWGLSFGLQPFSTINYSFYADKTIQGTGSTTSTYYEGTGGLNKVYVANAYQVTKGLSVGLEAAHIFGQQNQTETISSGFSGSEITTNRNSYLNGNSLKLGVQYNKDISKKMNVAFGGTISNKTTLKANYDLLVKDGTTTIEEKEQFKSNFFTMPLIYTTGLAFTYKKKYTWAVDYNYQDWASSHYTGLNYQLVNSSRISTGFEIKNFKNYINTRVEKSYFQLGAFYNNSYLKINNNQIKDYGITAGAGLHSFKNGLGIQAAIEYGERGTINSNLIKEKYTQITLTILYRDFWFKQKRLYD